MYLERHNSALHTFKMECVTVDIHGIPIRGVRLFACAPLRSRAQDFKALNTIPVLVCRTKTERDRTGSHSSYAQRRVLKDSICKAFFPSFSLYIS